MKKFLLILAISLVSVFGFSQTIEQQTINELIIQLEETTEALEDTDFLLRLTKNELSNTNDVLDDIKNELLVAQEEIFGLRKEVLRLMVPEESILQLGIGYTYPNGAEIMLGINLPKFPIGIYGRVNIQFDNTFTLGIGLTIDL